MNMNIEQISFDDFDNCLQQYIVLIAKYHKNFAPVVKPINVIVMMVNVCCVMLQNVVKYYVVSILSLFIHLVYTLLIFAQNVIPYIVINI